MKLLFGLAQQGHIPTIQEMRKDLKPWSEIAKAIGWEEQGLIDAYTRYLEDRVTQLECGIKPMINHFQLAQSAGEACLQSMIDIGYRALIHGTYFGFYPLKEHTVVKLLVDMPEGLKAGDLGTIISVYKTGAYVVEFPNEKIVDVIPERVRKVC